MMEEDGSSILQLASQFEVHHHHHHHQDHDHEDKGSVLDDIHEGESGDDVEEEEEEDTVEVSSVDGIVLQQKRGEKRRLLLEKERDDLTLDDFVYRGTEGCVEVWEKEVRKGIKAKRAKCVAPIKTADGETRVCGKLFSRVPNCKRHVVTHRKNGEIIDDSVLSTLKDTELSPETVVQSLTPQQPTVEPSPSPVMSKPAKNKKTIYIVLSTDMEQKTMRRNVPLHNLKSLPDFVDYLLKEFKLASITSIGVFDAKLNEYVQMEGPKDLKTGLKFKIYCHNHTIPMSSTLPSFQDSSLAVGAHLRAHPARSKEEVQLRIELAAAYRLFEMFGWTDLIYNHLTVRVPGREKHFLINPFGLLFGEVTASSLVKVDLDGNIIDPGCTNYGINKAGYVIHSAIHAKREDLKCVMHCHSTAGVAVSCMKDGLFNMHQNSAILGPISYHQYQGLSVKDEEKESLVNDLGGNKVMILRNHGILACGFTIAEGFFNMYMVNRSCEMQIAALSVGRENLVFPHPDVQQFTHQTAAAFNPEGVGQKEFAALLRRLDSLDTSYMD